MKKMMGDEFNMQFIGKMNKCIICILSQFAFTPKSEMLQRLIILRCIKVLLLDLGKYCLQFAFKFLNPLKIEMTSHVKNE
jgi:hypothetical protein